MLRFEVLILLISLSLLGGCVDTGGGQVSFPIRASGVGVTEIDAGGWTVSLQEARVVFGPLWLCSARGDQASCETARAEFLDAAVVDLLDPAPQELGVAQGTEGFVGTYWFDYGVVSLLTQKTPAALPAANELGGSLSISGQAENGVETVDFQALVTLSQAAEGVEPGVPVVRRASEEVRHVIDATTESLLLRFDPAPLVRAIDFDAFVGRGSVVIEATPTPETAQALASIRVALQGDGVPVFEWQDRSEN